MPMKALSTRVEESVGDALDSFIETHGLVKERVVTAAILSFMELPREVRAAAMEGDVEAIQQFMRAQPVAA